LPSITNPAARDRVYAIAVVAPDEAWGLVPWPTELLHVVRGEVTRVPFSFAGSGVPTGMSAVDDEVWVAGYSYPTETDGAYYAEGTVARFEGSGWTTTYFQETHHVLDVWARASDDVWAVGLSGFVRRWDGQNWQELTVAATDCFYGVHGSAADDVWIVGGTHFEFGFCYGTRILHWNGSELEDTTPSGAAGAVEVRRVHTDGAGHAWASTDEWASPGVLRWDGSAWHLMVVPADVVTIEGVWGTGDSVWISGSRWGADLRRAAVLHGNGDALAFAPEQPAGANLRPIGGWGDQLWTGGAGGVVMWRSLGDDSE
jgi:hypothetical protein